MTNHEGSTKETLTKAPPSSSSGTRPSTFRGDLVTTTEQLGRLISILQPHDRIAIDTEADSLHCYREKLCLLQISVPGHDAIVDPLARIDLAPLRELLEPKEIVLHGADYDLRLLRRAFNFTPRQVFDTVIAARLLGLREFSLAALLKKYFGVELVKGSQKANWARRPLPARMLEYAVNDTHYLLSLAEKLEAQLEETGRMPWLRQSCVRAIEQAAVDRSRDEDEVWRVAGAGALPAKAGAVLRALWQWREAEAEAVDRPPFHILQNRELLHSAEEFAAGRTPDYRHFSQRRRQAFRDAAEKALHLPDDQLPVMRRRSGTRPTMAMVRRANQLKERRDKAAGKLDLEPNVLAPRTALEAIASDEAQATQVLVPWQRELLGVS